MKQTVMSVRISLAPPDRIRDIQQQTDLNVTTTQVFLDLYQRVSDGEFNIPKVIDVEPNGSASE